MAKAYAESVHSTFLAAKGAPEEIFKLTTMPELTRSEVDAGLKRMTDAGMRVIAVASGQISPAELPA